MAIDLIKLSGIDTLNTKKVRGCKGALINFDSLAQAKEVAARLNEHGLNASVKEIETLRNRKTADIVGDVLAPWSYVEIASFCAYFMDSIICEIEDNGDGTLTVVTTGAKFTTKKEITHKPDNYHVSDIAVVVHS